MEEEIKNFFGNKWTRTEIDDHVVDRIVDNKSVIDVGCGFNPYKKFNPNLVGIDIVNEGADVVCDILDYDAMGIKYDIAICYGVLHFNSYDWIRERLEWVVNNTKPKSEILMKVNPTRKEELAFDMRTSDVVWFDKWNHGLAEHFADIYSLEISNWREWRNPHDNSLRLKFDYRKVWEVSEIEERDPFVYDG